MNGQYELIGMVRRNDHGTSVAAAARVRRVTCKQRVTEFAHDVKHKGFIDDDLKRCWPDTPESSLRKRRTTMTQQNIILDTGRTRANRLGQQETVWVHRDYHPSPPPVVELEKRVSAADQIVRLQAQIADLKDMVALAFPYVEEAIEDPHADAQGRQRTKTLAARMSRAVLEEGKDEAQ